MVLRSIPLLILMGKKSAKPRKERMPACQKNIFRGLSAGDYKVHCKTKKGGSDPLSLFGPQAGRKEGVAPALFAYSSACLFRAPKLVKFCLIEG